ncbi:hypothetical protein JTE90_014562 [Oedothorax gibbosus]|uniref:3'-5' exonuclease domain-containing protein n=1 Tax=Oedothorax gibbosus TaxID=931172 RepID=A0AAV6UCR5_9ARAC|nr:hypothetical protein JTE90_014562 [Oedothorax gibbosus]
MSIFKSFPVKSVAVATAFGLIAFRLIRSRRSSCKAEKCILIENADDWELYEAEIVKELASSKVIGIDCEWVTVEEKRNAVSLLQLANVDGFCVLIRLSCIPEWFIPTLFSPLLSNENILKVGVGVYEDVNKLYSDYALEVVNFLDLRYLAYDLPEMQGKSLSLKSIGYELLGIDINKDKSVRCSNWDAPNLTPEQIKYAADDAIIAAKIFNEIKKKKLGWFGNRTSNFSKEMNSFLDVPFQQSLDSNSKARASNNVNRVVRSNKTRYSKPRQKPMYDNCQLQAPDGELLCSCDRSKAQWYVDKGLGEKINDNPFTVRLNFEPSGRPTFDNVFYCKEKLNSCVVCGKTENFHRKLVVPSEYRKYFPNLMKKNLSHDVLLLCVHCHKKSNILDQHMRYKLADVCDAPLGSKKNVKYKFDPEMAKVKSAATALFTSGPKIPEPRREELKQIIGHYYKVSTVTDELVEEARTIDTNFLNESFVPHGQKVYEYFCENGGLVQFEKMWRQHFLDTMKPQFLPDMWSVEHNHKRLAMQVVNHEREVDFDENILGLTPDLVKEVEIEK